MTDAGYPLRFLGGPACLDFANTVDWRLDETRRRDFLTGYAALLEWSLARAVIAPDAGARLLALARRHPKAADAAFREAVALREEIWTIANALDRREPVSLDSLNRRLAVLPAQPPLLPHSFGPWVPALAARQAEEPLWPVLWSLTALLTSNDAMRVRRCRADGCGWFFVDASPNGTRRWCSTEGCGNRERVRRAYAKSLAKTEKT